LADGVDLRMAGEDLLDQRRARARQPDHEDRRGPGAPGILAREEVAAADVDDRVDERGVLRRIPRPAGERVAAREARESLGVLAAPVVQATEREGELAAPSGGDACVLEARAERGGIERLPAPREVVGRLRACRIQREGSPQCRLALRALSERLEHDAVERVGLGVPWRLLDRAPGRRERALQLEQPRAELVVELRHRRPARERLVEALQRRADLALAVEDRPGVRGEAPLVREAPRAVLEGRERTGEIARLEPRGAALEQLACGRSLATDARRTHGPVFGLRARFL